MGITNVGGVNRLEKVWQGICSTQTALAAKKVDVGEGFILKNGVRVRIYFENAFSSNVEATLDVNGTGAFTIITSNGAVPFTNVIKSGTYWDLTYVEDAFGLSGTNVWIIENTPLGGNQTKGIVALSDLPSNSVGSGEGVAATPLGVNRAIQAVKDIADAAFPKSGGTITGMTKIENEEATLMLQEPSGSSYITVWANSTQAIIGAEKSGNSVVEVEASDDGRITVEGKTANISLTANGVSPSLNIRATGIRRYVTGLTEPKTKFDATNKEYVDSRFPGGSIILFYTKDMSGQTIPIPEGFTLCDGNNNTPNLTALAPADCVYILREQ